MPLKLVSPRKGKTPFWSVRGTHLGVHLDRSTRATTRVTAAKFLTKWKAEIERGAVAPSNAPTFFEAAVNYMAQTGNERFVRPVLEHFGKTFLRDINQQTIDRAAFALYPRATPATRNRQVHTVISAILKLAGFETKLKRPKGWRGKIRTAWLKPEQAFRLFKAADELDPELGILLRVLCYTGLRLGEALALKTDNLELSHGFAQVKNSKNGDLMGVFLPAVIVASLANHPRGLDRPGEKVFRFIKCGRLYTLLRKAKATAGCDLEFVTFHVFRHTWATWMRRYAKLDVQGLLATQRWKDATSARRYQHVVVSEESCKAELLPLENSWKGDQEGANPLEKKHA
jgi:integrase